MILRVDLESKSGDTESHTLHSTGKKVGLGICWLSHLLCASHVESLTSRVTIFCASTEWHDAPPRLPPLNLPGNENIFVYTHAGGT